MGLDKWYPFKLVAHFSGIHFEIFDYIKFPKTQIQNAAVDMLGRNGPPENSTRYRCRPQETTGQLNTV